MARILVIDDDDAVRTMLRLTLAHFGHTVIEARNGREGLDLFRRAGADLVITDIVMPDTEGLEVVMDLRRKHPAVKMMLVSNYPEAQAAAVAAGAMPGFGKREIGTKRVAEVIREALA